MAVETSSLVNGIHWNKEIQKNVFTDVSDGLYRAKLTYVQNTSILSDEVIKELEKRLHAQCLVLGGPGCRWYEFSSCETLIDIFKLFRRVKRKFVKHSYGNKIELIYEPEGWCGCFLWNASYDSYVKIVEKCKLRMIKNVCNLNIDDAMGARRVNIILNMNDADVKNLVPDPLTEQEYNSWFDTQICQSNVSSWYDDANWCINAIATAMAEQERENRDLREKLNQYESKRTQH